MRTTPSLCVSMTGLKESMRQAELNNWSLDLAQMADLCSSINQFFTHTGIIPPQGPPLPTCHSPMDTSKPSQHINTGQWPLGWRCLTRH